MANISVALATVDGIDVGFIGSGTGEVDIWTLDDPIDVFDFDGPIEIILDFDDQPLFGSNNNDPFLINSVGNLGTLFSDFTLTIDQNGVMILIVDGADFLAGGTASFNIGGRGDSGGDTIFIDFLCFAQGTLIDTPSGPTRVEDLSKGDLVTTMNHGTKALRWVGSRTLNKTALRSNPHLRPITIQAHAFGAENPSSDLTVSPQHRILMTTAGLQLNFGLEVALAPAKGLVDDRNVVVSNRESVTYYHLLFDRHEIVRSNGTWTESLFPGQQSLLALDDAARREVLELFPQLALDETGVAPAAPFLSVRETTVLSGRMA